MYYLDYGNGYKGWARRRFSQWSKIETQSSLSFMVSLGFKVGLGLGQGLELRIVISAWLSILSHFTDLENLPLAHPI